jgi:hypothetical protein
MAIAKKQTAQIIPFRKRHSRTLAPVDVVGAKFLDSIAANEEVMVLVKKFTRDDLRSAAQNRLMWMWYTDMEKTTVNEWSGRSKEDWHFEMKRRFLVPIFERDDDAYALMLVALRNVYKSGMKQEAEALHKHIVSETSTTDADVKQFTEYLNEIHRFCGMNGIWLRTDQRLFDEAMGVNA